MNNINSSQNAAYHKAIDISGGQQNNAISGILKANRLGAYNQFAAQDATLHLQNQHYADQVGQGITNQRNLITGQDIQNRNRQEQAWGGALQSGLTNVASAGNFYSMTAGGYNPYGTTPTAPSGYTSNAPSTVDQSEVYAGTPGVYQPNPWSNPYKPPKFKVG